MPRKLVIGDIHGALKALTSVVEKIHLQPGDELVFVGDYVDGWSQSAQVIDYLINLSQTYDCTFLKGNHDAWCEDWLKNGMEDPEWIKHGGRETVDSYNTYQPEIRKSHLKFFESMPYFELDPENRLFVHAGFSSMHGPAKEHFKSSLFWDRTLWELALATPEKLDRKLPVFPKRLKLFKEIFIGHTPTTNFHSDLPMHAHGVWNVDTGAAFKGRITALEVNSKQYWQSDPVWLLYPNEKGRNK